MTTAGASRRSIPGKAAHCPRPACHRHSCTRLAGDGGPLHTADPTPLVIAGPTVRADDVTEFGELPAHRGWYGQVRAAELLPLLLGHANRPVFLGHRITSRPVVALADHPEPMRLP